RSASFEGQRIIPSSYTNSVRQVCDECATSVRRVCDECATRVVYFTASDSVSYWGATTPPSRTPSSLNNGRRYSQFIKHSAARNLIAAAEYAASIDRPFTLAISINWTLGHIRRP